MAAAPRPSQVCRCHHVILLHLLFRFQPLTSLTFPLGCAGEKRKIPEALTLEDAKRIRVMGDIPMELVNEVMMTITDPAAMLGPEARRFKMSHREDLSTVDVEERRDGTFLLSLCT